ncbi:MAG TPA: hypothetical protein VFK05_36195 [Polyangiaceae bacterium]|nr:hypothetical protein [Polyangiaceae bacterium]
MKRRELASEPELEALLNPRRVERRAPPEVRARAMARVRAIAAAGGRIPAISALALAPPPSPSAAPPALPVPRGGLVRLLVPASFAAVVAIGGAVALRSPTVHTPAPGVSAKPSLAMSPQADDSAAPRPVETPPVETPPLVAPAKPLPSVRPEAEVGLTELQLLGRAQSAYTHHDFTRALALIGELSRRFPNGHLAEEREALRVRSLLGAGRTDEGQRAAAAFANRFPRSVLLPKQKL